MGIIVGGVIGSIIIILCVVYCIVQHLQNRDVKLQYIHTVSELTESNEQKMLSISKLFEMLESATDEKEKYKERVLELENSIKKSFGFPVRKEITLINTNLLKFDYVLMQAGISKLIKDNPEKIEDTEYYINLVKRLQSIMDQMPEIQEEKGVDEIKNGI